MTKFFIPIVLVNIINLCFDLNVILAQNLQLTSSDNRTYRDAAIILNSSDPLNLAVEIFEICENQGYTPRLMQNTNSIGFDKHITIEFSYSISESFRCGAFGIHNYRILIFKSQDASKGRLIAQASKTGGSSRPICSSEFISSLGSSFAQFEVLDSDVSSESSASGGSSFYISPNAKKGARIALLSNPEQSCNPDLSKITSEFVEINLSRSATIINRSLFENILNEQKNSLAGLISDETLIEVGASLGAEGLVSCEVLCVGDQFFCSVKWVDTETTEVMCNILCPFDQLSNNLNKLNVNLN